MGPVMHVCTLHLQMGDRGTGERGLQPWWGQRVGGRLRAPPSLRIQVKVSLATCPRKHTVCGRCSLWSRDTALDIFMLNSYLSSMWFYNFLSLETLLQNETDGP